MIPLYLRIKGLYSYQNDQVIDFQPLLPSRLFGIFGAVGSGKSTILEAISFALYGQTERLNKNDNRNYNMMNLKSKKLEIDFVFKSGGNDDAYRFMVLGKRHSKKFEKIHSFERKAYKKVDQEWQAFECENAEEIIGLNYENFRRTVIIPQNKFQEFLQLGPKDRTTMLKELFNLDRFELYNKAASLDQKNREKMNIVSARLSQLEESDAETIAKQEEALREIEEKNNELKKARDRLQKQIREAETLQDLFSKKEQARLRYQALKEKEPGFAEREKRLNQYEYCLMQFRDILKQIKEEEETLQQVRSNLKNGEERFQKISLELSEKEKAFQKLKTEYEQRNELSKQAREFQTILSISKLKSHSRAKEKAIADIVRQEENVVDKLSRLKKRRQSLQNQLRQSKSHIDLAEITAMSDWIARGRHVKDEQKRLLQKREKLSKASKALEAEKQELINRSLKRHDSFSDNMTIPELVESVELFLHHFRQKSERLGREIEKAEHLNRLAGELVAGKPCPLCGAEEHPHPLTFDKLKSDVNQKQQKEIENKIMLFEHALKDAYRLSEQEKNLQSLCREMRSEQNALKDAMDKHKQSFAWPQYEADEAFLSQIVKNAEAENRAVSKGEKDLEEIMNELEQQQRIKEEHVSKRTQQEQERAAIAAEANTLLKNLETIEYEKWQAVDGSEIEKERQKLLHKVERIEKQYLTFESEIISMRQEKDRLSGTITAAKNNIKEQEKRLADLNADFEDRMATSEFDSFDQINSIVQRNIDCELEKQELNAYKSELNVAGEKYNAFKAESHNKTYNRQHHIDLQAELEKTEQALDALHRKFGEQQTILDRLKQALKIRQKLAKELDVLTKRDEDLKILKQLFKGSGFVNYVSSVYLHNLCKAANERFYQLTQKNLRLEVDENNAFQVRDYLNQGKRRSVKTLSGGQTFQAALSLALALAASIQRFHQSDQTFFFLDEGFGALDRDSLRTVMHTLKSLQRENRTVGVISHVEEMQQEIDIYLKIINERESGSRIIPSWQG